MAGEYRKVLPKGLNALGMDEEAALIKSRDLMIALSNSIRGNVTVKRDLSEVFIKALEFEGFNEEEKTIAERYRNGLLSGAMVPVVSFNGQTYTNDKIYAPGELFFTT